MTRTSALPRHSPIMHPHLNCAGFIVILVALPTIALLAQDRAVDSVRHSVTVPRYFLDEVIITATRIDEPLLEVPMAVSVVPPQDVQRTRQLGLPEALILIPGVFAQSRSGSIDSRITIRGYGARGNGDRSNAGNLRGIRILRDGIPLTEPDGRTSLDFVDLSTTGSIEILRSNGSALYGGASGGVIQLRSTTFDQPYISVQSLFGGFGFRSQTVEAGFTDSDARYAVSMNTSVFDGWRVHSANDRTIATAAADVRVGRLGRLVVSAAAVSNAMKFPGALTREEMARDPRQADPLYLKRDERRMNRQGQLGASLRHMIGDEIQMTVTGWVEPKILQRSERGTFRDFTRYHIGGSASCSWIAAVGEKNVSLLQAGIDEAYQDGAILFYSLSVTNGRGSELLQNKREGANSFGAFLQEEFILSESWSILAGIRADMLRYESNDFIDPVLDAAKRFDAVTPKLGLTHRITPFHSVYASVGGGIEAPAFNEIDPPPIDSLTSINPLLEPMRSTVIEIGAKGVWRSVRTLFLETVQYDIAAYAIRIRNDLIPWNAGRWYFTAGRSHRIGFEAQLKCTTDHGFDLTASGAVSKNAYDEYRNDIFGDLAGKRVAGLPEVFGAIRLRYNTPWRGSIDVTIQHSGQYYAEDSNADASRVDRSTIIGVSAFTKIAFGVIDVELHAAVENLFDTRYTSSVFINGVNGRFFEPGVPRSVFAGVRVTWARG